MGPRPRNRSSNERSTERTTSSFDLVCETVIRMYSDRSSYIHFSMRFKEGRHPVSLDPLHSISPYNGAMVSLLRRSVQFAIVCILSGAALSAQDWKTTDKLPGIDFSGLSAAQKTTALKILREHGCSCGCSMKLA